MKKLCNRILCLALTIGMALSFVLPTDVFADELPNWAPENQDLYEELEEELSNVPEAGYDGFIVGIREDLNPSTEKKIENSVAKKDGIHDVDIIENTYFAEDIEAIQASIGEEYIEYIEPNYYMTFADGDEDDECYLQSATNPNDPQYANNQYNLVNLKVKTAWEYGLEGQDFDGAKDDIVIAVIDSGVYSGHKDFQGGQLLTGLGFGKSTASGNPYVQTTDYDDKHGHGTRVTGIIGATRDNGYAVAGILSKTKILPIKVTEGSSNSAPTLAVAMAINYIAEQKERYNSGDKTALNVCVANISLTTKAGSADIKEACQRAMDAGIIIVCAAGNIGGEPFVSETDSQYPAQYTMGVGGLNKSNERWIETDSAGNPTGGSVKINSTNGEGYLNKVWVMAPAVSIPSTSKSGGSAASNGTSYASPEVAALAAICKGIHNDLTQEDFMELLKQSATMPAGVSDFINNTRQSETYGWGIVDFDRTIKTLVKITKLEPTCTTAGKTTLTCKHNGCGTKIKEIAIPSLGGHNWDAGVVTKPATTTETGIKTYTCRVCNETKTETIPKITVVPPTNGTSIKTANVAGLVNKIYTGNALTQSLTIKLGSKTLKLGRDYTLSYKNNVAVGTATVTIKGKGDYTGSISKTFKITTGWKRLWGRKALDTMKAIATEFGKSDVAVLTTSADFKDALSVAALAGRYNAPILMTTRDSLSEQTSSELKRMGVKTVYILGSDNEVAKIVENQMKSVGVQTVKRYKSSTAAGRAIEACKAMGSNKSDTVIIATQNSFKDALSISPYSYASKSPILYAESNLTLSQDTLNHIRSSGFKKAIIVGGPVALPSSIENQLGTAGISQANITRLAGGNAYKTSQIIAEWATGKLSTGTGPKAGNFYAYASIKFQPAVKLSANKAGVATGKSWYDALAGGALCGKNKAVLLLADDSNYSNTAYLKTNKSGISIGYVFGGPAAVSKKVYEECEKATK